MTDTERVCVKCKQLIKLPNTAPATYIAVATDYLGTDVVDLLTKKHKWAFYHGECPKEVQ